jgi:hypothetical protein
MHPHHTRVAMKHSPPPSRDLLPIHHQIPILQMLLTWMKQKFLSQLARLADLAMVDIPLNCSRLESKSVQEVEGVIICHK